MRGWWQGFAGRHPLFVTAVAAAACVVLADGRLWHGLAAGVVFGMLGAWGRGWRSGLALWLCGWLAAGVFAWRDGALRTAERELVAAPPGTVEARILRDAQGSERFWLAAARITEGRWKGVDVWWKGKGEMPVAGSRVRDWGKFTPLEGPRNPGEFDRAAWLRRRGVAAEFESGWRPGEVETGSLAARGARVRRAFRDAVTAGLEEDSTEARVIRAVVIGEQPPDAETLIAAFRNSGTLHVFSVSGLHVAMVGGIGWCLLGWAGVPRRRAVLALLPLVFGYAWITGHSAPAVRSACMAAVFLGAFVFRRKPDLLNALGAVLLGAALWDGRLLFQPGVQLSYGVVAAIAVGTAWAARVFSWMAEPELYLPEKRMNRWQLALLNLRRRTAQSLSVSLAAGVGSAPLTAAHFGLVTPVSVLAGLVLVPLVFVLLAAALLGAALSPLPPLSHLVNRANGRVAALCVLSARGFSSIPGGHWRTGGDPRPALIVYDLEYGAGAACFSGGDGGAVLIDCGDAPGFKRVVAPSLRKLGIQPDSVVLSHPDGGHLGGASAVWEALPVRQALMPVALSRSPSFRRWMNEAPPAGIRTHEAAEVATLAFPDGAALEVLHAPDPLARNTLADDRVAVFRLHWRGWRILFTSDAGMLTERKLLESGKDLSADVIVAGRHRTDLTLGDRFLDAVNPLAIIASNPVHPPAEHLPPASAAYWKSRGIRVIDQRESGGVTVRVDDDGALSIDGFLAGGPLRLMRR